MRLTLRTLLAYLDDTLEPAQAKLIGQKVAESDTAQELIERIKQVTRRRRLAAPPTSGPGGNIDPNTIAEYLDNEVTPEQSAEVEQVCLASDVHLAEVAACHQILTLVLGEPALVPPTAKQRMYALVKGKESNQFRKAPKNESHPEIEIPESNETDETLRMGLPPFRLRADMKQRLMLWGGGALAAILLVVAMWQILGGGREPDEQIIADNKKQEKAPEEPKKKKNKVDTPLKVDDSKKEDPKKEDPKKEDPKKEDPKKEDPKKEGPKKEPKKFEPLFLDLPARAPSKEEVAGALYVPPPDDAPPSVLLQNLDKVGWKRVDLKNSDVITARPLVSLPGFRSTVETPSRVRLTLWGIMPELWPTTNPIVLRLFESSVVLNENVAHPNGKLDLDITLRRGRITLSTTRTERPTRIRLRYPNPAKNDKLEYLDISLLDQESEILIERSSLPYFITGFEPSWKDLKSRDRLGPVANMALVALSGRVQIKVKELPVFAMEPPPGSALLVWNNRRDQFDSVTLQDLPKEFVLAPPAPKLLKDAQFRTAMRKACAELNGRLSGKDLETELGEAIANTDPSLRQLGVRCLGALENTGELIELLQDKTKDVRRAAIQTLENWIVQERDNDHLLLPAMEKRFGKVTGGKIMEILHGEARPDLLSDYLTSPSQSIREMAQQRLEDLDTLKKMMPPQKKKGG